MRDLIIAVLALFGGGCSAWLSDRCISSAERSISLFDPIDCAACGRSREFWDKVPLLSWLLNGGRCRFCGAVLSKREPLITFCTIAVWMIGLSLWMPYGKAYALINAVNASALLCAGGLCWIGASERPVLLPFLICTGIFGIILPDGMTTCSHLIGAAGLLAFGLLLRFLPEFLRGRERLRMDTILYLTFTGMLLGWQNSFAILPAAIVIVVLFMLLRRKKQISPSIGKKTEPAYSDPARGDVSASLCLTCASSWNLE